MIFPSIFFTHKSRSSGKIIIRKANRKRTNKFQSWCCDRGARLNNRLNPMRVYETFKLRRRKKNKIWYSGCRRDTYYVHIYMYLGVRDSWYGCLLKTSLNFVKIITCCAQFSLLSTTSTHSHTPIISQFIVFASGAFILLYLLGCCFYIHDANRIWKNIQ